MKYQNIKIIKSENKPETPELLARSIIDISEGFRNLLLQGLSKRAIITLLLDMPEIRKSEVAISRSAIEMVLDNIPKLGSYYLNK